MLAARLLFLAACVAAALGNFCYNNESLYLRFFEQCLDLNGVDIGPGGVVAPEKQDLLCSVCIQYWESLDLWYTHRKGTLAVARRVYGRGNTRNVFSDRRH